MNKIKVITVVGTRPEIIKLSCVIRDFEKVFNHILVNTNQNFDYELNRVFFDDLNIKKPDYNLSCDDVSSAKTISNIISLSDEVFEKEKPDAVLVYGDTNSCLCVISAKKRKIPIFHMEAGNRCFDQRVPEEINRKIVDHLSDINMTISEHARRYLINEGLPPERTIKVGSSMKEVIDFQRPLINKSKILNSMQLTKNEYFIISIHRDENISYENNFNDIIDTIKNLKNHYGHRIIVSTHPKTKNKLESLNIDKIDGVEFLKPFGFNDYIKLQENALCVISDSGTITEEASILNIPAITIRNSHERPEGMDNGVLIMSGLKKDRVLNSIETLILQSNEKFKSSLVNDYSYNISKKISRIIISYIDYINKNVWKKMN